MKILLLTAVLLLSNQGFAQAAEPYGLWLTQNERSVIKVDACGDTICGKIAWIIKGGMQYDEKNPKENLRSKPMCGLKIMYGLKKKSKNNWAGGKIYKADDGDIYKANLTLVDENKIKVRGYVGVPVLGKTQIWKRVNVSNYPSCEK